VVNILVFLISWGTVIYLSKFTLAYTAITEAFNFQPYPFHAKPEDKDFARGFWDFSAGLLANG
jgi:hypothetical protein